MGSRRAQWLNDAVLWGIFLVLGGIFILLNNLGFFGDWGPLVWPVIFAMAGLGFLGWHIGHREQWGALVPGFTLVGLAATIYLGHRETIPDAWLGTIFLASIGLGFWLIFLFHRDQWWAVIPAGNLWVLGILAYLNEATDLDTNALGAVFFMGLGLVFTILYLLRSPHRPLWWASVPAAALLLFGIIVFLGATGLQATYWPLLLIFLGLGLLVGQYWATRPQATPQAVREAAPLQPASAEEEMAMPIVIPLQPREAEPPPAAAGGIEWSMPPEPSDLSTAISTDGASADAAASGSMAEPAWWQTAGESEERRTEGDTAEGETSAEEEEGNSDTPGRRANETGHGEAP